MKLLFSFSRVVLLGAYHASIMPGAVNEEREVQGKLGRAFEMQPVRFSVVDGWGKGQIFSSRLLHKGNKRAGSK